MKKNLINVARALIISGLLYASHFFYNHYTYIATASVDFDKVCISMVVHALLFFIMGVVLRFDLKLIAAFKRRAVRIDGLQMALGILAMLVLWVLRFRIRSFLSFFIAFLGGYFMTSSLEHQTEQKESDIENSEG